MQAARQRWPFTGCAHVLSGSPLVQNLISRLQAFTPLPATQSAGMGSQGSRWVRHGGAQRARQA